MATGCALLMVWGSSGWVTKSQSNFGAQISEIQDLMKGKPVSRVVQAQLGFLWTYPASTTDHTGLGRGITWAWDSKLCDLLKPKFKESVAFYDLVTCNSYKSAVARAFDKWAANSAFIKFIDVTSECEKLGLNYGPPTGPRQTSEFPHGGCPLAKIWITRIANGQSRRRLRDTIDGRGLSEDGETLVEVDNALSDAVAVATALSHARYTENFRYTNGERPHTLAADGVTKVYGRRVVETYAGTFSFNVEDICWYLDSNFCANFHLLKKYAGTPARARLYVTIAVFGVMALGILVYSCVAAKVLFAVMGHVTEDQKAVDEDGDGVLTPCERSKAALRELATWNPFILALFVVLIICPPLMQSQIFMPCFDCHDFEATALHEIGHFLGLGHPDNIPNNMYSASWAKKSGTGQNSYQQMLSAGGRTNVSNCRTLWDGVMPGVSPHACHPNRSATPCDKSLAYIDTDRTDRLYDYVNAQMEHETQHSPRACLTNDDLEALAVLYPDCGDFSLSVNVCHKVELNLGMVRIGFYVIGPFIIGLVSVLFFVGIVHKFADDERKADRQRAQEIEEEYRRTQAQMRSNAVSSSRTKDDPRALEAEYNRAQNRARSAAMAGRQGHGAYEDRQYF